jgi:hypothetical protein
MSALSHHLDLSISLEEALLMDLLTGVDILN